MCEFVIRKGTEKDFGDVLTQIKEFAELFCFEFVIEVVRSNFCSDIPYASSLSLAQLLDPFDINSDRDFVTVEPLYIEFILRVELSFTTPFERFSKVVFSFSLCI